MSFGTLEFLSGKYSSTFSSDDFCKLSRFIQTGEFRDVPLSVGDYVAMFGLLWNSLRRKASNECEIKQVRECRLLVLTVMKSEEFDGSVASIHLPDDLISCIVHRANPARINEGDLENEVKFIESVLSTIYRKFVEKRAVIRGEIGRFLRDFTLIPTRSSHLTPILNVLNLIISGMRSVDRKLFRDILLPLHKPNGWSFWDRQLPVLGEYHRSLLQCCHTLIEKEGSLATELVEYILTHGFPAVNQSNTAKELLLLFEISKVLNSVVDLSSSSLMPKLMQRVLGCINSENAQVVQSVLILWKSPPSFFPAQLKPVLPNYMGRLLQTLFRGCGEPHWNPTVNKMTLLVLRSLEESEPELFELEAEKVIPEIEFSDETCNFSKTATVPSHLAAPTSSKTHQPPLSVTGVAPWKDESSMVEEAAGERKRGVAALREFISRLGQKQESRSSEKPPWLEALSSDTPTLMPELKFHNLVFGKNLGVGAFSSVRYARVVKPGKFLSQWQEVAVKMISYSTISEHQYGENILREICCLRKLAHPSIARLISSFRWRDGIYLVLEFGGLGDLHTYVRRKGGLPEPMAQIVVGEIATALVTVHESGFVYGDLKPENVVITATRHVKLVDFGACRPLTVQAKTCLIESRNDLRDMRSGDWKDQELVIPSSLELSDESILSPKTFEGTTLYLPPEAGKTPSVLSDAYALGLTTYFLLKARLPQWAGRDDSDETKNSMVKFQTRSEMMENDDFFTSLYSPQLAQFVSCLVQPDVEQRSTVEQALLAPWFDDVQDVRKLYLKIFDNNHLPGAEEASSAGAAAGGEWEKRQLSKIWTVQPADYALGETTRDENSLDYCPLAETDVERNSLFI